MSDRSFRILAYAGSLRRQSYNRGLVRAAREVAPQGVEVEILDLAPIPMYNADLDGENSPAPVREFRERIGAADALLIATPEYNYSVPGVLKNAIDWASRPWPNSVLRYKPAAIMGASGGTSGTVRAQLALRQVFLYTETYVMLKPELHVPGGREKFDAEGTLKDEPTRERLRAHVEALAAWAHRLTAR
ncbi:MAG: NAD(P)H-dependent oxidoreductase [Armatimonadetes bacterium]|nr:NAD(P)H-dependent oxidoreductase [Armatimonadota bacterium]